MLTRRQFGAGVALTALSAPLPAEAEAAALNMVLVGDWGRGGHHDQSAVAAQMGRTAAEMRAQRIVSVGDNFYENGVTGTHDAQWQGSFEKIYTAPALQVPWQVILGNHDYRGNVQAQLDYSGMSPRWRMPARYYARQEALPGGGTAAFFYLDTSPFITKYIGTRVDISGQDTAAQLAWLDAALAASTADWKIVIGHHPVYTALSDEDGEVHDQPDLIARLNPLLARHQAPLYICGHDHTLQAVKMGGIRYVVTGAGSETYTPGPAIRGGFACGAHGFMTLALTRRRLDYALLDLHGKTLYAETITRG